MLSLFVLLGKRDKTNYIYSIFVLFASLWAVGLAFFLTESDLLISQYIANFYYIAAAGIPTFFLYFSLVFLAEDRSDNRFRPFLVIPFFLLVLGFIFDKSFLIKEVYLTNWGKDVVINKINYIIFSIYFLIYVILAYFKLLYSYLISPQGQIKDQLKFIILGTSIGFIFGMVFNLILPAFGDYSHIYLGPLFSIVMVASIAYSMTKHNLFNMKIIVTELLVFIMWLFIFIRTIVSTNLSDQIVNGAFLAISVIIGYFLIKSVIKEVHQREEIQKLADDLKMANQGQASLMHFMNHQMKGRLGNIKNIFAELLTDDYGEMPADTKPLLAKGLDEANIGVNYVQNILRGASAENGTLPYDMKTIDFKAVVEDVFGRQKEYAESRGLKITFEPKDGNFEMVGDSIHLSECVKNLIDNSINYTLEGSINISLFNKANMIRLEIKDTGVGITDEDRPKLFKSGGRGSDSLKINVNSTGYGLAFVKGVIETHKGKVWAESEGKGKGSTFIVELPKKI